MFSKLVPHRFILFIYKRYLLFLIQQQGAGIIVYAITYHLFDLLDAGQY